MADVDTDEMQEVAKPTVWPGADVFLADHYGLSGDLEPLETDPPSFLLRYEEVTCRLQFGREPDELEQFQTRTELLSHIHAEFGRVQAPRPLEAIDGSSIVFYEATDDHDAGFAIVYAHPPGEAPNRGATRDTAARQQLGLFAARLIRDLTAAQDAVGREKDEEDDARVEQPPLIAASDLRQAGPVVVRLLRDVSDPAVRDPIAKAMVTALRQVQPIGADLRVQLIHHHPAGKDLVGEAQEGPWVPTGFTDPAALGDGWIVASLAALCADLIDEDGDGALAILPAVAAFHAELPLQETELKALWPLTIVQMGLNLAAMERWEAMAPGEATRQALLQARRLFEVALGVHPAFMHAAILDCLDWPLADEPALERLLPEIDPDLIRLVDLSATSSLLTEGNWEDPEVDWRLLARIAWDTKMGATRYGEYRMSRAFAATGPEADNLALHVDLCVPAGTVAVAPFGGMVRHTGGRLLLTGKEASLHLEGLDTILADGTALFAGDRLGVVAGAEGSIGGLRIRLGREAELLPPLFATPATGRLWKRLSLSPSLILGLDVDAPEAGSTAYVRGWREHVFDPLGFGSIDLSGAAGLLGHGHPALAEAAYRQWLMINGLSGTPAEMEFQAALLQRMPGELDTIIALTDEAQALELAVQLGDRLYPQDEAPIIADERRTGFGRTGDAYWAFERDGVTPDIVVTGSPVADERLAAVILRRSVLPEDLQLPRPDASAVACRIGTAVIDALEEPQLRETARQASAEFMERLRELQARASDAFVIEGEGLSLDLVFEAGDARAVADGLAGRRVLVQSIAGDRLRLTGPLCLSLASIDRVATALAQVLGLPEPEPEEPPEEPDAADEPPTAPSDEVSPAVV
ncbi:aminotransferase class III-fold pyridoxal phosphate-dependent enzyme [Rhizobium sp. 0TCS1.26]|uniref:aminotransferase class III-fold pyridoxal phosphate-dependent enzyme n=1 Tax=Rhizobium sp. 0TCS1.26 TaxID=3142623 RepID=UPI003D29B478